MKINILFLIAIIFFGCERGFNHEVATDFGKGKPLSELTNKKLKESSGLAASAGNPGMLWTLNDSGNDAEIYLVDEKLEIKMTVTLAGVVNRDWEDIAVGPGPDSSLTYIYVGDIGDNDAVYPYKYIYRIPEPLFEENTNIVISDFDKIIFRLEDGIKDTESLFIDAKSKDLYVVSKREEPVVVYALKYPQAIGDTLTSSKVTSLPFKEIVAADCLSGTGDILMKNYTNIYYWKNTNGLDVASLLKTAPLEVPYEEEPQGESIAWAVDGSGFFTLSEKKKKQASYLYFYARVGER